MINLYQQRDFGDKINATFQYASQNFKSLATSLLFIVGPLALIAGVATGIFQSNILSLVGADSLNDRTDPTQAFGIFERIFSPAFWVTILFTLVTALVANLTTYSHMKLYAAKNGGNISVGEVWETMQPAIGRVLLVSILATIATVVASFALIIPGIYVSIVLSLALPVTIFEGTNFPDTCRRCLQLIRDKWWSTFGLIFIMSMIAGIIGLIFTLPAGVINMLVAVKMLPDASGIWVIVANTVSAVGSSLIRALTFIALGFQYTNLIERQEGRGLSSAIDSIGTPVSKSRLDDEGDY